MKSRIYRILIKCDYCGISTDPVEHGKSHKFRQCGVKRQCKYCNFTDFEDETTEHEKIHKHNKPNDSSSKVKNITAENIKVMRKCTRCGKVFNMYATDVCQSCGDD